MSGWSWLQEAAELLPWRTRLARAAPPVLGKHAREQQSVFEQWDGAGSAAAVAGGTLQRADGLGAAHRRADGTARGTGGEGHAVPDGAVRGHMPEPRTVQTSAGARDDDVQSLPAVPAGGGAACDGGEAQGTGGAAVGGSGEGGGGATGGTGRVKPSATQTFSPVTRARSKDTPNTTAAAGMRKQLGHKGGAACRIAFTSAIPTLKFNR